VVRREHHDHDVTLERGVVRRPALGGEPEYVGVIATSTWPVSSTVTSRRMPRSSIVSTGTSGSGTAATAAHTSDLSEPQLAIAV
jgi:hypothetical protein